MRGDARNYVVKLLGTSNEGLILFDADSPRAHIEAAERFVAILVARDAVKVGEEVRVEVENQYGRKKEVAVDVRMEPVARGRPVEDPRAKETPR